MLRRNVPGQMLNAHRFLAGTDTTAATLVLLHGSDGTESDLFPLADELEPRAAQLGIRGTVTMDGGYGFFRRRPDRRLDEADIAARVPRWRSPSKGPVPATASPNSLAIALASSWR